MMGMKPEYWIFCSSSDLVNDFNSYIPKLSITGSKNTKIRDFNTLLKDQREIIGVKRYMTRLPPDPNQPNIS